MPNRSRAVCLVLAVLALAPAFAAGRPMCCVKAPVAKTSMHDCCRVATTTHASAQKACCKPPVAPRQETRVKDAAPIVLVTPTLDAGEPASVSAVLTASAALSRAQRAHHAEAPDDSPPDLLSRTQALRI